ncbi:MAG: CoA transferase [Armatimonadota bacterium]|nr:CoA transferase [Armatimonadota bacterium]
MGPLDGVRIVDLSIGQMGPAATALLADYGAEVIKVESLHGDPGRGVELQPDGVSAFFLTHNRGKKSLALNLRHPQGREAVLRLAERSDVFVQSWTPGTVERLGLGYEVVRERNPGIIYASASGFGPKGPKAKLPAMDMVAQGVGGLMAANAGPGDAEPIPVGPTIADQTGAFLLALGIALALLHRRSPGSGGRGQEVHVSLLGGMVALQGWHIAHYLMTGRMALMSSQRTRRSPLFTFYRARDGWFTIAIIDPSQWPALCRVVGLPELVADPRFADTRARNEHAAELIAVLDERFAARPRDEWLRLLEAEGIPCGPVHSYAELAADPQVVANGYIVDTGGRRTPGLAVGFSETPGELRPAPELGQHTEEVLQALGYSWDDILRLRDARTIL